MKRWSLFLHPLNLVWACDLLWPAECGRSPMTSDQASRGPAVSLLTTGSAAAVGWEPSPGHWRGTPHGREWRQPCQGPEPTAEEWAVLGLHPRRTVRGQQPLKWPQERPVKEPSSGVQPRLQNGEQVQDWCFKPVKPAHFWQEIHSLFRHF